MYYDKYVIYVSMFLCICYVCYEQHGMDWKVSMIWAGRSAGYGPEGQHGWTGRSTWYGPEGRQSRTWRSTPRVGPEGP